MLFVSAQDINTYFLWQINACLYNLNSKGILKEKIHVLFALERGRQLSDEDEILLKEIQKLAQIFFYEDNREEKKYPSSIRPHIIAQHFLKYSVLEKEIIFYHDCDIIFRELPPLLKQLMYNRLINNSWYVSDTSNYLNTNYIKANIGEENFVRMCKIVGIAPATAIKQDSNCGGAQYIMKNVSANFWQKVEQDCKAIHTFLENTNRQNKIVEALKNNNSNFHGIQSWCADMWAVLWNALYFNQEVKIHPDLNFTWPKNKIEDWSNNYVLHNAGVDQSEAEQYFYKGNYVYQTPFFESLNYVDKQSCSFVYLEAVKQLAEKWQGIELSDFTFLIPVMIDSEDRMDNLFTVIRYLQKHFQTNIIIYEYGKQQSINTDLLPNRTLLLFEKGSEELFHRTYFNNKLIDAAITPFISIYDTDVVLPVNQILEAVHSLRSNSADVVYPYSGAFVSMDKLASVIFSKFLDDKFFEENNEKFIVSTTRSFGGCVMLNKKSYCKAGKENIKFTSWGPEDIERYHRMKILGYKVKRVDGPLYHLCHKRGINSGYYDREKRVAFMEEYIKIFNMQKNELKKYVATW